MSKMPNFKGGILGGRLILAVLLFAAIFTDLGAQDQLKTTKKISPAESLQYSFIKKGGDSSEVVLIIGGIQGDEPGGFLAASLIAMRYHILKGAVWVVPNLNFPSIIKRNRGIYGDMNRKFAQISQNDPYFSAVEGIKELITAPSVAMVVHLHDGSGFYRPKYESELLGPNRWGNIAIIDQKELKNAKYGELENIANRVVDAVNTGLLKPLHKYHLRNTKTSEGDKEMLQSLTYFAIKNGKAAFANEASKTLPSYERVYYHLLALEEYLRVAGVEFARDFELTPQGVKDQIEQEIEIVLFENRFYLSLHDPRSKIGFVPVPKGIALEYSASNPLIALTQNNGAISVHYGNRTLTKLTPQYFAYSALDHEPLVKIDENDAIKVGLGDKISAKSSFEVLAKEGVRANIIGYAGPKEDESAIKITKNMIDKNYSIDKAGRLYRVELYEIGESQDKFIGMFLVGFE